MALSLRGIIIVGSAVSSSSQSSRALPPARFFAVVAVVADRPMRANKDIKSTPSSRLVVALAFLRRTARSFGSVRFRTRALSTTSRFGSVRFVRPHPTETGEAKRVESSRVESTIHKKTQTEARSSPSPSRCSARVGVPFHSIHSSIVKSTHRSLRRSGLRPTRGRSFVRVCHHPPYISTVHDPSISTVHDLSSHRSIAVGGVDSPWSSLTSHCLHTHRERQIDT